jgi:hypothetical protein
MHTTTLASSETFSLDVQFQAMRVTSTSASELVIAIDFGTTFIGVAFAHSGNLTADNAAIMIDSVRVINTWPSQNQVYADKTPTVISYHKTPPAWGGSVTSEDTPRVEYFKLGLQASSRHYLSSGAPSNLPFLDPNWRHPDLPEKTAVQYAGDYLTCINQFVKKVYMPKQFGPAFLNKLRLSYVITVPAIWKDSAKAQTRQAAEQAGIVKKDLDLVTEPEAAALYCATLCVEADLYDGDRFIVCDAGGGTVV